MTNEDVTNEEPQDELLPAEPSEGGEVTVDSDSEIPGTLESTEEPEPEPAPKKGKGKKASDGPSADGMAGYGYNEEV